MSIGELVKGMFGTTNDYSKEDLKKSYSTRLPSFASRLPYAGWHKESQTFILEDLISRAVVLTIQPIATEGKSSEQLARVRDAISEFYSVFEERTVDSGQWVIQEYSYEDNGVDAIIEKMRDYVKPHAKGTKFTESYLKLMERHYRTIAKEDGLYHDKAVTNQPWRFKTPRTKLIIYRRQSARDVERFNQGNHCPAEEITRVLEDIKVKFSQAGVGFEVDDDIALFSWLYKLFNPNPEIYADVSKDQFYEQMCDVDSDLLVGSALCEALLTEPPKSDVDDHCWYFNGAPTRFLRFGGLRKPPRIGALSGEVTEGEKGSATNYCVLDALPANTVLTKTVVIAPEPDFDKRQSRVEGATKGHSKEAKKMSRNLEEMDDMLQASHKKVFVTMGAYVAGANLTELEDNQRKVFTVLYNANIQLYKDYADSLALESFVNHLPMNFRPEYDRGEHYLRTMYAQHSANLFLGFGRGEGTGNPVISFFNRGGTPSFFDPFSKQDKNNNSFGFIAGPSGAGKSVTITQMVYSIMAMLRPRMFLVEYGDSYSMAAKDWEKKGLTVNYLKVMPDSAPILAPFARIDRVLDSMTYQTEKEAVDNFSDIDYEDINTDDKDKEDAASQGDTLGELELILLLMITGSENAELERYNRADRSLFRQALVDTAKRQRQKGLDEGLGKAKPTVVDDIKETLEMMAADDTRHSSKRLMLSEAALALDAFTSGINGRLFNTPGESWPDADITIFNVGLLSQESNAAQLNVAMLSLLQHINNLSEHHQFDERDVVSMTDEAHLFLNNQMLGKILTRVVKTARKLGHVPFFATQDLADLEGESKKILNNIEWFYCLNFGYEEAQKVADIKQLSQDDVDLMTSTQKQDKCYTEGVAVSKNHRILFRITPPSLMLTIAMTESDEKAERRAFMREHAISDELEAVYEQANHLDKLRGIPGRIEYKDL